MGDEDKVASIDIHKKVLMVVVGWREGEAIASAEELERRRFGTTTSQLGALSAWLRERKVKEVVMESTAQYWKPVWMELEPYMRLHLAQAFSNRAPKGRKQDFRDAERLRRRFLAGELILSFVPDAEQRNWRTVTRMKAGLARHRGRLYSQVECLLEEMRIKLSCVLSDLFGASGLRILRALAQGETDPKKLATLGDDRLKCTEEQLVDALTGNPQATHRVSGPVAVGRQTNGQAQRRDRRGPETASRGGGATGGGARFRTRLGTASDCRSGRAGQHLSLGRELGLLGRDLPRGKRIRGGELQQSLAMSDLSRRRSPCGRHGNQQALRSLVAWPCSARSAGRSRLRGPPPVLSQRAFLPTQRCGSHKPLATNTESKSRERLSRPSG